MLHHALIFWPTGSRSNITDCIVSGSFLARTNLHHVVNVSITFFSPVRAILCGFLVKFWRIFFGGNLKIILHCVSRWVNHKIVKYEPLSSSHLFLDCAILELGGLLRNFSRIYILSVPRGFAIFTSSIAKENHLIEPICLASWICRLDKIEIKISLS